MVNGRNIILVQQLHILCIKKYILTFKKIEHGAKLSEKMKNEKRKMNEKEKEK